MKVIFNLVPRRCWPGALTLALLSGSEGTARAAGYDPAVGHAARHVAVGGTAVASVDDPSSLAHNPAGLVRIEKLALMASGTLMVGRIHATPEPGIHIDSQRLVAPLPMLGVGFRPFDRLAFGLLVHPLAAAGAVYEYESSAGWTRDVTRAAFVEAAVGTAVEIVPRLRLGLAYRVTIAQMHRYKKGDEAAQPGIDMSLGGTNFAGFRAGLQWQAIGDTEHRSATDAERLAFGVAYRHTTRVHMEAETGTLMTQPVTDAHSALTLPGRLVAGVRGDLGRFGLAFDFEYAFTSRNHRSKLGATLAGNAFEVPAIYEWRDAITLRVGAEARVLAKGRLALRTGYVLDGAAPSQAYPTPFGPPPAPTHVVTLGAGLDLGGWSPSLGYGYRFGGTTVEQEQLGADACPLCGGAGRYEVGFHTIAADVVYRFD